jgi:hypothetical protein
MISMTRLRIAVLLPLCISFFLSGCSLSGLKLENESQENQEESAGNKSSSRQYPTNVEELTKKQLIELTGGYVSIENTKETDLGVFTEEFETNSLVAEEKYTKKPVKLKAKIDSIDNDMSGDVNVVLKKPYEVSYFPSFDSVVCEGVSKPTARNMKKGEIVIAYGYVMSTDLGVRLNWCYFGESEPQGIKPSEFVKIFSSEEK